MSDQYDPHAGYDLIYAEDGKSERSTDDAILKVAGRWT